MSRHDGEIPDPKKIGEILDVVGEKAPDLLRKLSDVLYGPDQARKYGKAAALFYRELKGTGMSDEEVFQLTKQYMASLNMGGFFKNFDHEKEDSNHGKRLKKVKK